MSSTTLHLRLDAPEKPLHALCDLLTERLGRSCEIVSRQEMDFLDGSAAQLLFEKFFFRNGSYAGLSLFLTENEDGQSAHIAGFGGGEGLFNISLWANDDLAEEASSALEDLGFRPSDDE